MNETNETNEKKSKTTAALGIYLGPEPDRTRRREALKAKAVRLGEHMHRTVSVSEMLQMIADGELEITVPARTVQSISV